MVADEMSSSESRNMAGAWHAAKEAALRGMALTEIPLMREIDRYNEIDCRVMAEVLDHLRREH